MVMMKAGLKAVMRVNYLVIRLEKMMARIMIKQQKI